MTETIYRVCSGVVRFGVPIAAVFLLTCRREPAGARTLAEPEQRAAPVASTSTRAPDLSPPSSASVAALREYVARSHSAAGPREYKGSPEEFSKSMKGTISCGKKACRAGQELCVSSPGKSGHCERIVEWLDHRTPKPEHGFPGLAGLTACDGSHNCPKGSVCCLHELGLAEVQAVVCHAALDECRDREESCSKDVPQGCRTPGTRCEEYRCVPR